MNEQATQIRELTVELPVDAPLIRVTAGMGSAGQKTWNLRRAVTVIGSRRPAHIVLHDENISNAHCVIVNTGTEVLLKDLHTSSGTRLNKACVNLAVLSDGDVIALGHTTIQVAIQVPDSASDDSAFGMEFGDPTKFPGPVSLHLIRTDKQWSIVDAVVLIGRHDDATVRLDHADLSSRHALLFRIGAEPAIFDLGSRTGLWVNGQRCSLTPLHNDDRLTIGPFGLSVRCAERSLGARVDPPAPASNPSTLQPFAAQGKPFNPADVGHLAANPAAPQACPAAPDSGAARQAARPNAAAEPGPDNLPGNISEAWERLNLWRAQLRDGASVLDEQQTGLDARAAELDAKDAALRGQLHDVTRFHEQILTRERELAAKIAELQAGADALAEARKACDQREADLACRDQEMNRREHALAQRWSRLSATTCPHCRQPVNVGNVSADPS